MQGLGNGRHTGFSHWLRTGRWPGPVATQGVERKFNPWHDPDDGRFTFAGTGRHFGSGGQDRSARPATGSRLPARGDEEGCDA